MRFPHVTGTKPLIVVEGITDRNVFQAVLGDRSDEFEFFEGDGGNLVTRFKTFRKESKALTLPAICFVFDADSDDRRPAALFGELVGVTPPTTRKSVMSINRGSLLDRVDLGSAVIPGGFLVLPQNGDGCVETLLLEQFPTADCFEDFERCVSYDHVGSTAQLDKRRWAARSAYLEPAFSFSYERSHGRDLKIPLEGHISTLIKGFVSDWLSGPGN
jgi:hypothetical protein